MSYSLRLGWRYQEQDIRCSTWQPINCALVIVLRQQSLGTPPNVPASSGPHSSVNTHPQVRAWPARRDEFTQCSRSICGKTTDLAIYDNQNSSHAIMKITLCDTSSETMRALSRVDGWNNKRERIRLYYITRTKQKYHCVCTYIYYRGTVSTNPDRYETIADPLCGATMLALCCKIPIAQLFKVTYICSSAGVREFAVT